MELKKKRLIVLAAGLVLLVLMILFGKYTKTLLSDADRFAELLRGSGIAGMAFMLLLVVVQVLLGVVPAGPFQIAAGYVYGPLQGAFLCVLGGMIGSVTAFLLVRRFGRRLLAVFCDEKKLESLERITGSPRWKVVLPLIFVIPGSPKDILSYAAGLTDFPLPLWAVVSSVGRLPAIILSALSGSALKDAQYGKAAAVLAVVCVISAAGGFLYRRCVSGMSGEEEN